MVMKPAENTSQTRSEAVSPPGRAGAAHVLQLSRRAGCSILALGAELKAAVCFYAGCEAALIDPVGDLSSANTYRRYVATIEEMEHRWGFRPELVAHDLHPRYMSTEYARTRAIPTIGVQHHHAHIMSVAAEWRVDKAIVGICCDGVGYGADGAAWGCEVLKCEAAGFERAGHLDYFPLLGGDAAAREPGRPAAALLHQAFGDQWRRHFPASFAQAAERDLDVLDRLLATRTNSPPTSSLGRVFDGVSFLLRLCRRNEREAQAAIALESAACGDGVEPYAYATTVENGAIRMSMAPVIRAIVQELAGAVDVGMISARFHETVARMLAATADMVCEKNGISTVALSGGCFANQRLLARLTDRLERRHLRVLTPRLVSCGDAGLALGQAVVAASRHERAGTCA